MDNKTSVDKLGIFGEISCKRIINKLDDNSADMETEGVVLPPSSPLMVDNGGLASSPITPDSNTESSDMMSCFTSPSTLISGLEKPMLVKSCEESRSYFARRLNFSSVKTLTDCEKAVECDDMLLEAVYESILECIVLDILGEISAVDSGPDALKTPFGPRLTGIAETCPGPPLKSVKKSRNFDLSLCRKLEF
ncbi:hypothetical protein SSX86_022659 [Deinandra increscens subsp. villosa]|uniref:Uncharacterized protein n=1 Tax=Deinandra increscens subsp. villosa TaxID=3103831 RepID=A0AAP0CJH8_9ASTR